MVVQILSDKEYASLLTFLQTAPARDGLIIRFLVQCGLRAGEVANLNIESVWQAGFVRGAVYLAQGTTKNHRSRYVDMPEIVRTQTFAYINDLITSQGSVDAYQPLFKTMRRGNRLTIRDIHNITRHIMLLAVFRPVNPHTLRHTYATILLRYTNIRVVQMLLGHSSLTTTEIYLHPNSAECKTAVDSAFSR